MNDGDVLRAIDAQIEATKILAGLVGEDGAQIVIARLARHDPPILLAYPHEIREQPRLARDDVVLEIAEVLDNGHCTIDEEIPAAEAVYDRLNRLGQL